MYTEALKAAWAELTGPGAEFETAPANVCGQLLNAYKHALPNLGAL
jgi:hypothetical protein